MQQNNMNMDLLAAWLDGYMREVIGQMQQSGGNPWELSPLPRPVQNPGPRMPWMQPAPPAPQYPGPLPQFQPAPPAPRQPGPLPQFQPAPPAPQYPGQFPSFPPAPPAPRQPGPLPQLQPAPPAPQHPGQFPSFPPQGNMSIPSMPDVSHGMSLLQNARPMGESGRTSIQDAMSSLKDFWTPQGHHGNSSHIDSLKSYWG